MGLVEGVEGELEAGCWNEVEKEAAGEERKEEAEIEVEDVEEEREEEAEEKFGGDALPGEKIQKAVDGEGVGMDEMAGAGEADKVVAEVHSTPREDVAALIEGAAAEEKEIRPSTIGEP